MLLFTGILLACHRYASAHAQRAREQQVALLTDNNARLMQLLLASELSRREEVLDLL